MFLPKAVNWIAADQLRFGAARRSKSCSLSLITPSGDDSARAVNCSTGELEAAMHSGTAASAMSIRLSIVDDCEEESCAL